ncbi:MAG TPA: YihY/virulence factor BrkB family protein, partial [Chloroflexota bacterium]
PFWIAKLRGLGVTLWVVVFAIASLSASWAWGEMLQVLHVPHALDLGWTGILPIYALDVCLFTALYILTPTCKVDRTGAVVAAASAAAMWGLTKLGFAWWVLQVGTYNRVYGPLAASVIVMLWIWLSGIIFLFGAELAVAIQRRDRPLTDSSVAQGA